MIFSQSDYDTLASLVFRPDYPGYRPNVVESPHGDGVLDAQKKFAHVATKYLANYGPDAEGRPDMTWDDYQCFIYLRRAYNRALVIAAGFGMSSVFWPRFDVGTLRVLDYPPGTGGALHTDFDLFTINLWRNVPNIGLPPGEVHVGELGELLGLGPATPHYVEPLPVRQLSLVYFATPSHDAVLPSGETVGEWINERMKRSRYDVK